MPRKPLLPPALPAPLPIGLPPALPSALPIGLPPAIEPDDPEQSQRFIEAARAAGTDDSPEAFERVFKKVAGRKAAIPPSTVRPASRKTPARGR
jgi:hypothetical protein